MTVLTINQGDTISLTVAVVSPAGAAVDLTGSTLTFVVKRNPSDTTAVLTKTSPTGITIAAGTGGTATVNIAPVDTEPGPTGVFVWEIEGTDSGGNITTLAGGSLLIVETLI